MQCPRCGRNLIGAGICPAGDYRAPTTRGKANADQGSTAPTPSAYTPPVPPSGASSASSPPPHASSSSPDHPKPHPSAARPFSTPSVPPPLPNPSSGGLRYGFAGAEIRGVIDEVGSERMESVSLAAHNAMSHVATGVLTAIPRAIGLVLALLFEPLRMLFVPSLSAGSRRQQRPSQVQVPVTPFVLRGDDGNAYDCILRGEVRGGFLKLGEPVEVIGRIDRSSVVRVSQVRSLRTNAITTGWVERRAKFARIHTIVGFIAIIFLIFLLLSLVGHS
jgi:hypothetical protein